MLSKFVYCSRDEWLKHRRGIGGSNAAAVMGLSPYMSNVRLWEILTGRATPKDISDLPVVQYGTKAEHLLRELFALDFPQYEVFYEENNVWEDDETPFAHASLDGWLEEKVTGRKGILEIKTAEITSGALADRWKDQVPMHYFLQVMHYFIVTGWDFAVLKAQLKFFSGGELNQIETRHYYFDRESCAEDIETLKNAEIDFWNYVTDDKAPPLKLNI